jgi:hypothetical protein
MHHRIPSHLEGISNWELGQNRSRLTLKLDLVLYNQSLALVVNLLGKLGGNGMMGSSILDHQTLITIDSFKD